MSPEKDEYLCVSANHATPTEKQWHQIFYDENVWQIGWMRSPNSLWIWDQRYYYSWCLDIQTWKEDQTMQCIAMEM